jgi:hypothetical protein
MRLPARLGAAGLVARGGTLAGPERDAPTGQPA